MSSTSGTEVAGIKGNGTTNGVAPVTPVLLSRKPSRVREEGGARGGVDKTACIRTLGCQMNVHDSDWMRCMIRVVGIAEVQRYEYADVVVLNKMY